MLSFAATVRPFSSPMMIAHSIIPPLVLMGAANAILPSSFRTIRFREGLEGLVLFGMSSGCMLYVVPLSVAVLYWSTIVCLVMLFRFEISYL